MPEPLKAPFPYFGGKSRIAHLVWERLGDCQNYVEPFFGSGAVLLLRPPPLGGVETVNDLDSYLANFWRATQHDPEAVASHADGPVNEVDLHARHRWLVLSDDAATFRERMRTDPHYFDARMAGWWCWGLCCWIGSGWCDSSQLDRHAKAPPAINKEHGLGMDAKPMLSQQIPAGEGPLTGGNADAQPPTAKRPLLSGDNPGSLGKGIHAGSTPSLRGDSGAAGSGVHASGGPTLSQQIPHMDAGRGVHPSPRQGRPQLADAYDIGRGVNSHGELGTCAARRVWLLDWFGRLRDRLRNVRVCCGDWSRVCSSDSVTTRLGTTGVFLDPPYSAEAKRSNKLYAQESRTVAHDVRRWCLERGSHPLMRICLAGYQGEGHEELEAQGWDCLAWKAQGGYGNRSETGKKNAGRERLWFSPHCVRADLFAGLEEQEPQKARRGTKIIQMPIQFLFVSFCAFCG